MSEQRLNVNLTVEAQEAVAEVQSQTNLKKADIANRAVVMYSFLLGEVRSGGEITVRREGHPDTIIKFF